MRALADAAALGEADAAKRAHDVAQHGLDKVVQEGGEAEWLFLGVAVVMARDVNQRWVADIVSINAFAFAGGHSYVVVWVAKMFTVVARVLAGSVSVGECEFMHG